MRMRWQAAAAVVSALLLCLLVVELLSNQGLLQLDRFSSSSTGCRGAHSRHPDSRLPHSIRSWCGEHGSSGASAEAQRTSDCRHRHRSRAQLLNCSSSYGPWLLPAYNLEKGMLLGDTQRVAAAMSRLLLQGRNLTVGEWQRSRQPCADPSFLRHRPVVGRGRRGGCALDPPLAAAAVAAASTQPAHSHQRRKANQACPWTDQRGRYSLWGGHNGA